MFFTGCQNGFMYWERQTDSCQNSFTHTLGEADTCQNGFTHTPGEADRQLSKRFYSHIGRGRQLS